MVAVRRKPESSIGHCLRKSQARSSDGGQSGRGRAGCTDHSIVEVMIRRDASPDRRGETLHDVDDAWQDLLNGTSTSPVEKLVSCWRVRNGLPVTSKRSRHQSFVVPGLKRQSVSSDTLSYGQSISGCSVVGATTSFSEARTCLAFTGASGQEVPVAVLVDCSKRLPSISIANQLLPMQPANASQGAEAPSSRIPHRSGRRLHRGFPFAEPIQPHVSAERNAKRS